MKKILFAVMVVALGVTGCTTKEDPGLEDVNPQDINQDNPAVLTFEETVYDFGKLVQGDKVTYEFKFTNTGKSRLIIVDAKADCGCTVPEWPKEPIEPGASGVIKVVFNSYMKPIGPITREVRVRANTYPETITKISMTGEIVGPGAE